AARGYDASRGTAAAGLHISPDPKPLPATPRVPVMASGTHTPPPAAPSPSTGDAAGGLLRWVSCNNPFYVLSACVFLVGLWASFQAGSGDAETWALMSGLAGYTLLLAVTAFVLVRFANAWDDLRTVLLLVVLMFLATSVTFVELLVVSPGRGF